MVGISEQCYFLLYTLGCICDVSSVARGPFPSMGSGALVAEWRDHAFSLYLYDSSVAIICRMVRYLVCRVEYCDYLKVFIKMTRSNNGMHPTAS